MKRTEPADRNSVAASPATSTTRWTKAFCSTRIEEAPAGDPREPPGLFLRTPAASARATAVVPVEVRSNHLARLLARHHRHDLEGRTGAAAVQDPLLQQP